jgi:hypothetical protein
VNGWIVAVVVASGLTLALVAIFALGYVSLIVDLGRTARRFRDEVGGLADEVSREASRAGDRAGRLRPPGDARRG